MLSAMSGFACGMLRAMMVVNNATITASVMMVCLRWSPAGMSRVGTSVSGDCCDWLDCGVEVVDCACACIVRARALCSVSWHWRVRASFPIFPTRCLSASNLFFMPSSLLTSARFSARVIIVVCVFHGLYVSHGAFRV